MGWIIDILSLNVVLLGWLAGVNLVWLFHWNFQIWVAHCELVFRLLLLLNYRALEHVHPSPPPAEPTSTTLNHSITLDTFFVPTSQPRENAKLSQSGEESLGESSSQAGGPLCTTVPLLSCTLNCPSSSIQRRTHRRPPSHLVIQEIWFCFQTNPPRWVNKFVLLV